MFYPFNVNINTNESNIAGVFSEEAEALRFICLNAGCKINNISFEEYTQTICFEDEEYCDLEIEYYIDTESRNKQIEEWVSFVDGVRRKATIEAEKSEQSEDQLSDESPEDQLSDEDQLREYIREYSYGGSKWAERKAKDFDGNMRFVFPLKDESRNFGIVARTQTQLGVDFILMNVCYLDTEEPLSYGVGLSRMILLSKYGWSKAFANSTLAKMADGGPDSDESALPALIHKALADIRSKWGAM